MNPFLSVPDEFPISLPPAGTAGKFAGTWLSYRALGMTQQPLKFK
jgi:hypothetical protein